MPISILKAAGLQTGSNELSSVPDGAMTEAKNLVIRSKDLVEPRRGFGNANLTFDFYGHVRALGSFAGKLLAFGGEANNLDVSTVSYFDGTGLQPAPGTASSPSDGYTDDIRSLGGELRSRPVEAKKSVYIPTYFGVKKMGDLADGVASAGIPKPIPVLFPATSTTGPTGTLWMAPRSWAAWVVVFGIKDPSGRIILGEPSSPAYAQAGGALSRGALTIRLPNSGLTNSVTANHFMQLYRTESAASKDLLSPDYYLVLEQRLTSSDISAGSVSVNDNTPDGDLAQRGYFSANEETIAEANNEPPLCVDMCLYGSRMLYANTAGRHGFYLDILGVDPDSYGTGGLKPDDRIVINGVTFTASLLHRSPSNFHFLIDPAGGYDGIYRTARWLADCINNTGGHQVFAYPVAEEVGSPGALYLERRDVALPSFTVSGEAVYAGGVSTGPLLCTSPYLSHNVSADSTNEEGPNRIYYSKRDIPEAVPAKNYITVGAENKKILRIMALRERLYVFKEDGIFTISGDMENCRVYPLDPTVRLLAPDSVAAVNNEIYALTSQGVVAVSDSGVRIVSKGIERELTRYIVPGSLPGSNLYKGTWACGYESERLYILGIASTTNYQSDKVYVYNVSSQAWTWWDIQARCGFVLPETGVLYLGGDAGPGCLKAERKTLTQDDYYDESVFCDISEVVNAPGVSTVTYSTDSYQAQPGDVFVQGSVVGVVTKFIDSNKVEVSGGPGVTLNYVLTTGAPTALEIRRAYECVAEWAAKAPGGVASAGTVREMELVFRDQRFWLASAGLSTQPSGTPAMMEVYGTVPPGTYVWGSALLPSNIRVGVNQEVFAGWYFRPRFRIREAQALWSLQGITLLTNGTSEEGQK